MSSPCPRTGGPRTPARRDGVRLLVGGADGVTHHAFTDLPDLLDPGDLLVVNTSATLPAAVRLDRLAVHFSGPSPSGPYWLVELRMRAADATAPYAGGCPGRVVPAARRRDADTARPATPRLWRARLDTDVVPYLRRHGVPIRYGYVGRDWPLRRTRRCSPGVPSSDGGSAEMPSAGRPFTTELVTRLVSRGMQIAPLILHTGVASPEKDEPPYAERYDVPAATARLVNHARRSGGRVIAVGTTVVRALETAAATGRVRPGVTGWTSHVVTPDRRRTRRRRAAHRPARTTLVTPAHAHRHRRHRPARTRLRLGALARLQMARVRRPEPPPSSLTLMIRRPLVSGI